MCKGRGARRLLAVNAADTGWTKGAATATDVGRSPDSIARARRKGVVDASDNRLNCASP